MSRRFERAKRVCLELPLKERSELIEILVRSIDGIRSEGRLEFMNRGASLMLELFGADLFRRCRERSLVDAKTIFCYRMRKEGIKYRTIGDYLGINHATVIYHCEKMSDAFDCPRVFADLITMYNDFDKNLMGI